MRAAGVERLPQLNQIVRFCNDVCQFMESGSFVHSLISQLDSKMFTLGTPYAWAILYRWYPGSWPFICGVVVEVVKSLCYALCLVVVRPVSTGFIVGGVRQLVAFLLVGIFVAVQLYLLCLFNRGWPGRRLQNKIPIQIASIGSQALG